MKARPKREDFDNGTFGDIDYEEALEKYIDYLLRYYVNKTKVK